MTIGGIGSPKVSDDCAVKFCSQPGPAPLTSVVSVPRSAPTTTELIPSVTTSGSSLNRWQTQPLAPPQTRQMSSTMRATKPKFQCSRPVRWVVSRLPATM